MLAGLEEVTAGSIHIGERDITHVPPKGRDIAMVFQNCALHPHMSVADNMAFSLKMAGVSKEDRRTRVEEAAKLLDLTDYLDRKPKALSGGQRQRVAMGRRGVYAEHLDDVIERGLATGDVLPGTSGLVEMGSLKVLLDGSLNTRTAWCYHPFPGVEPEAVHGMRVVEPDALHDLVARAYAVGMASALHAIGDRANTLALDTFEATGASGTIEHAQLIARQDLARFARLGVAASVQPRHAIDDRAVAERHWSGHTDRAFLLASLLGAGARILLGSDAPVAPLDPWVTIASAVARTDDEQPPWHGEERLTLDQALAASTRHPQLTRGAPADLVVLDADPWDAGADVLSAMPVEATMIAGEFVPLG
jgi:hypothetical protein